jgi:hypothetical protein
MIEVIEAFNKLCWMVGFTVILIAVAWPFVHRR